MKRNLFRESANDQPAPQFEDDAANDDFNKTDLREHKSSSGVSDRRWRRRFRIHEEFAPETLWIVIALYLILVSVSFVAL